MVKDRVLNHAITAAYEGFSEGRIFPVMFLFTVLLFFRLLNLVMLGILSIIKVLGLLITLGIIWRLVASIKLKVCFARQLFLHGIQRI